MVGLTDDRVPPVIHFTAPSRRSAPKLLSYVDQLGLTLIAVIKPDPSAVDLQSLVNLLNQFKSEFEIGRTNTGWTLLIDVNQMVESS